MFGVNNGDLRQEYLGIPADLPLDSAKLDPNNADGPFVLGTIFESLVDPFEPLNPRPHRVEVSDNEMVKYTRTVTNESRARNGARDAATDENPWIRFNCSGSSRLNITCDALESKFSHLDEIDGYVGQCLDSEPIKRWLEGKEQPELYMITAIQVAKGLRAAATTEVDLSSRFGSGAKEIKHEFMPRMHDAVIVLYRVTKLTLFRRNLLNQKKPMHLEHGDWGILIKVVRTGDDYDTAVKKFKENYSDRSHWLKDSEQECDG